MNFWNRPLCGKPRGAPRWSHGFSSHEGVRQVWLGQAGGTEVPVPPPPTPATTCLLLLLFSACLETFLRNRSNLSLWETPSLALPLCFGNQTRPIAPWHPASILCIQTGLLKACALCRGKGVLSHLYSFRWRFL